MQCDGTSFGKLNALKRAVYDASKVVKRRFEFQEPQTTEGKLAISISFLRAIFSADMGKAK